MVNSLLRVAVKGATVTVAALFAGWASFLLCVELTDSLLFGLLAAVAAIAVGAYATARLMGRHDAAGVVSSAEHAPFRRVNFDTLDMLGLGFVLVAAGFGSLLWVGMAGPPPEGQEAEALWAIPTGFTSLFGVTALVGLLPVGRRGARTYCIAVLGFVASGFLGGVIAGCAFWVGAVFPLIRIFWLVGLVIAFVGGVTVTAWKLGAIAPRHP